MAAGIKWEPWAPGTSRQDCRSKCGRFDVQFSHFTGEWVAADWGTGVLNHHLPTVEAARAWCEERATNTGGDK